MISAKHRGHPMRYIDEVWVYTDNGKRVSDDKDRPCGDCGKSNTTDGHDGCLGTLPNTMNACCGHGIVAETYLQLLDGTCLSADEASERIKELLIEKDK